MIWSFLLIISSTFFYRTLVLLSNRFIIVYDDPYLEMSSIGLFYVDESFFLNDVPVAVRLVCDDDLDLKLDELWALDIILEFDALCIGGFWLILVVDWELERVLFGSFWRELFFDGVFPLPEWTLSFVGILCVGRADGYSLLDLYIWFRNLLLGCQLPNCSKNPLFLNTTASVNFPPDTLGPLLNY